MTTKSNCHIIRRTLVGKAKNLKKARKTVFRNNQKMIKCEKCGNYFPLDEVECHHSIISFREIRQAFVKKELSREDARYFARSEDNVIIVCRKCHRNLHKVHYHK